MCVAKSHHDYVSGVGNVELEGRGVAQRGFEAGFAVGALFDRDCPGCAVMPLGYKCADQGSSGEVAMAVRVVSIAAAPGVLGGNGERTEDF